MAAMIKDAVLKLIFIPLLGIFLPVAAGIISYDSYSVWELVGANLFFILTSALIWGGCNWIHGKFRPLYSTSVNPFTKMLTICLVSALYGACIGGISALTWLQFSSELFNWTGVYKFLALCVASVIIFTLIYEILFLSKERELDSKIVHQLDQERSQAALQALHNELDPHFIFNSLNTLNYLIMHDPPQAHLFNNRLALVYKYILINKNRELVPLTDELEFIDNYFFLLQIRHDKKLQLEKQLSDHIDHYLIPPCAVQLLIENAIKHNQFSEKEPLLITIRQQGEMLKVSNNVHPKKVISHSMGIGLKNLQSRYHIIRHTRIRIEVTNQQFIVTLPLITQNL